MSDFAQRLTRALTIRYVAVLVIIGALAVGSFLGLVRVLMDAESGTAIVNASARQRALVERAADLAVQVQAGAVQAGKIEQDLHATLDRLETVHLGLLQGMPELKRPQPPVGRVKALYYGPDGALDADLRLFLQHGRGVLVSRRGDAAMAGDVAAMVEAVKGRLGQQLDALTGLYQQENLDRLRHMFGYHAAVVALVLFLLVLSAAAVFRPMVTRIRDDLGERLRIEKKSARIGRSLVAHVAGKPRRRFRLAPQGRLGGLRQCPVL